MRWGASAIGAAAQRRGGATRSRTLDVIRGLDPRIHPTSQRFGRRPIREARWIAGSSPATTRWGNALPHLDVIRGLAPRIHPTSQIRPWPPPVGGLSEVDGSSLQPSLDQQHRPRCRIQWFVLFQPGNAAPMVHLRRMCGVRGKFSAEVFVERCDQICGR